MTGPPCPVLLVQWLDARLFDRLTEVERLGACLDDMAVVHQSIQSCRRQLDITKYADHSAKVRLIVITTLVAHRA